MKTLYLIDGYAQFFRAYHAIRTPMRSPVTDEPTNMSFGFVGMLLKLLRGAGQIEGKPDYIAVALDVSGDKGTFRSRLYPDYKANRDEPPEDLRPQVDRMLELLEAIGVPVIGVEGFEADDVIATIATRFSEQHPDVRVRIVSKDKDLKQLLGSGIPPTEMYDIHTDKLITAQTLREEMGIEPAQMLDVLALMGDSSDNIPGVPGIGPKTAAKLIAEFGSLDAVIDEATADKPKNEWIIKGKRRENIAKAATDGTLALSRKLVALRRDTPIDFDLDSARVDQLDLSAMRPILKQLGFNRYQDELAALLGQEQSKAQNTGKTASHSKRQSNTSPSSVVMGGLFDSVTDDSAATGKAIDGAYRCVRTRADLDELIAELQSVPLFAVDTETTSVRPMRAVLCGLSFSTKPGTGWYVPVLSPNPGDHLDAATVINALKPILENADIAKVGHNIKYDILVLRKAGIELHGHRHPSGGDTMIASYLLDASRSSHSMDALALALLGRENIPISQLIGKGKSQRTFDTVPLDLATPYAAEDADVTLQLAHLMLPKLDQEGLKTLYETLEMPVVDVLAELEWNGIMVDAHELETQKKHIETRIGELRQHIADVAMETVGRSFDPDSPKQLASVLFNKPDASDAGLGLKPVKRGKTGPSTDAEVLDKLAGDPDIDTELPRLILEYRQLTKLVNTYLDNLANEIDPSDKRIHASFNQTVAATGRLSSSDPNLQNIPIRSEIGRDIRKAFVAPPGHVLLSADYSQIELRLLAHLSRDPALIEAFRLGQDIHTAVAAQIHHIPIEEVTREQRSGAKMVNFGIVYGVTPFGLARRLGISNTEAAAIIDAYKKKFSGITTFLEECIEHARQHGYVETMCKRRRPIREIDAKNPTRRALAERVAINSVVQGSAADLIKIAMVDLHQRLSPHAADVRGGKPPEIPGVKMILQIHDELVFEVPEDRIEPARALVVERMEAAMRLDVPLVVDTAVGTTWHDAKD